MWQLHVLVCSVRRAVATITLHNYRDFSTIVSELGSKVVVNNLTLHYEKVGSGDHALLLLPGALGSSQTDFQPQLEQLDRTKFTVVAWDPPGYGFSRPPDRCFSPDMFYKDAEAAASLMKALNFSSYSLAGWSGGGISALILASRHTDKVRKLVVWGANAYVNEKDMKLYKALRNIDSWSPRVKDPMIAIYGETYFRQALEAYGDTYIKLYDNGGDICKSVLPRIVCPTLIIHGMKDPMVPEEHAVYLHQAIQKSRFQTLFNALDMVKLCVNTSSELIIAYHCGINNTNSNQEFNFTIIGKMSRR